MHINRKTDYALRATLDIAARSDVSQPATRDEISRAQGIPGRYLATILNELRRGGIVVGTRGPDGGYRLARPPQEISLADVIRVVDGALTQVGGVRPEHVSYQGSASQLANVWIALRAAERNILESTTLRDLLEL